MIRPSRGLSIRRWLCSDELHKGDGGRVDVLRERSRCWRRAMPRKKMTAALSNCETGPRREPRQSLARACLRARP